MTKRIEDELNLPRLEDIIKEAEDDQPTLPVEPVEESPEEVIDSEDVSNVANALQNIKPSDLASTDPMGTVDHEMETNEIYDAAMRAYKDLLDLGFNIESKHAGANAFSPAAKMLEIALKASQSKATKKMERIKAIMEQELHDRELRKNEEDGVIEGDTSGGGSFLAHRNDLMNKIRKGEI